MTNCCHTVMHVAYNSCCHHSVLDHSVTKNFKYIGAIFEDF